MAGKNWVFKLDDKQHTLSYEQSFSGKKKIQIDNSMVYESGGMMDIQTEFSFEVDGHSVVLLVKPGLKDSYDLFVDDRSVLTGKLGPDRVKVIETSDGLSLTYNSNRGVFIIFLLFALVFVGVSTSIMINSLTSGTLTLADMMFMPVLFLLVGLGMLYWSLVRTFDKTILTVTPLEISVKHTPFPWFGTRVLSVADVERLYCESYERKTRSSEGVITVTMKFLLYRICAKLSNGKKLTLISEMDKCYEATFINHQIAQRLGSIVQPGVQPT